MQLSHTSGGPGSLPPRLLAACGRPSTPPGRRPGSPLFKPLSPVQGRGRLASRGPHATSQREPEPLPLSLARARCLRYKSQPDQHPPHHRPGRTHSFSGHRGCWPEWPPPHLCSLGTSLLTSPQAGAGHIPRGQDSAAAQGPEGNPGLNRKRLSRLRAGSPLRGLLCVPTVLTSLAPHHQALPPAS
ncbi:hypothetical protein NDU88_010358 [Pleurodeles waltl]|uniref:Uncharacterized protein n=1 Tax=Pleurodeles waltl TaxID=8319 RepID=A0AAV7Q1P8_PLEWA|nr:hypothetical protein NDU88_010358 [Pleurodeles waltl]